MEKQQREKETERDNVSWKRKETEREREREREDEQRKEGRRIREVAEYATAFSRLVENRKKDRLESRSCEKGVRFSRGDPQCLGGRENRAGTLTGGSREAEWW